MTPRGRIALAGLCLAALSACDPGKELQEELDALADDHDVAVVADQRILVGGYAWGSVRDACGSIDNEECADDALAIVEATGSGQVLVDRAVGTQVAYRGATTPGQGSLRLVVQHEEHAEDPDGMPDPPIAVDVPIDVLPPDGALVAPYCTAGVFRASAPYLVPAGGVAQVTWSFLLDGRVEPGDDGTVPIDAPVLELVSAGAPLATFRAPAAPGLATVRSTTHESSFEFEIHDPAAAALQMEVRGLNFIGDAIELAVWSEVDGRPVCSEPGARLVTSETPAVCLVRYGLETFESHEITAGVVEVVPLAAGDCRIRAGVEGTALDAALEFAVAPLQPEDMWWQNTCESGGTTCGLACAFDLTQENGCQWSWTEEFTCGDDPAEISCHYLQTYVGLECPESADFPPYRVACWESP